MTSATCCECCSKPRTTEWSRRRPRSGQRSKLDRTGQTYCSSILACRMGTESKSSGAFGHGRPCRSLCSRRARSRRRRSRRSMLAPTTTSRNRSALRSSWHVCEPACAAMCVAPSASRLSAIGEYEIDLDRRRTQGPAGEIHLTPLEYRVLECLVRHSGRIVRPQQLLRESWGPDRAGDTRTLRVCIKNLRDKLEPNPRRPAFLTTDVGLGYRLTIP